MHFPKAKLNILHFYWLNDIYKQPLNTVGRSNFGITYGVAIISTIQFGITRIFCLYSICKYHGHCGIDFIW